MKFLIAIGVVALALVIGLSVFVRVLPFDADKFHVAGTPEPVGDYQTETSFTAVRQITTPPDDLAQVIDRVALATPRTERVAGAPGTELMTYRTRTAIMGFPDYTTVSFIPHDMVGNRGILLKIAARSPFPGMDMGVNETRVKNWVDALGPLTVQP